MRECCPGVRAEVERMATPEALSAAEPRVAAPSLKMTVPVGVPEAEPTTVAIRVIEAPAMDGLTLDVIAAVVFSWTTSDSADDVLVRSLVSPL